MINKNLPPVREGEHINFLHFPTLQQAFVFRNWEMFSAGHLAKVLGAQEWQITELAYEMGLPPQNVNPDWRTKGYLTIIRSNWHLIPYEQLEELLEWDETHLEFVLKEDDFLSHKLGMIKPDTPRLVYRELTDSEKKETEWIKAQIAEQAKLQNSPDTKKPFAFDFESIYPIEAFSTPFEGAVCIDETWGIEFDGSDEFVLQHIEDFLADYRIVTGVSLLCSAKKKSIHLSIGSDGFSSHEGHKITIESGLISIAAASHFGVLQGLIWLVKTAQVNGGAFYKPETIKRDAAFDLRIAYSYCAIYGDCTEDMLDCSYPDALLKSYAYCGVNGVWLQALLYKLTEFPFKPEISAGRDERIQALQKLIKRAQRYGIKIYLYLNEPRSMSEDFFEKYPNMRGEREFSFFALCTSVPEVKQYLENGIADVTRQLPGLGGYITITMSENLTNCFSRTSADKVTCPRCKERKPYEVVAEVNELIARGAFSINPDIEVIAWTWAWGDTKAITEIIKRIPERVRIMSVSEEAVKGEYDGVQTQVIDYSISLVGPGEKAAFTTKTAKSLGHPAAYKVQFNNTWECSAVPYIPAFDLVGQHRNGLNDVDALLLDWTLGGYPSVTFDMLWDSYFNKEAFSVKRAVDRIFGANADIVYKSQQAFSRALKEFPFHISTLYVAPQNYGPANLFYPENTNWKATMIGYPYDDVESWRAVFPIDIFENQWRKLCEEWEKGVKLLDANCGGATFSSYRNVATACYCHFKSTYNALRFTRLRDSGGNGADIIKILNDEVKITEALYSLILKEPCIGYEASNHYYYSRNTLLEKLVNLSWIIRKYQ